MKEQRLPTFIVIISFACYVYLRSSVDKIENNLYELLGVGLIATLIACFVVAIPVFIGNSLLGDKKDYFERLNLRGNLIEAIAVSGVVCLAYGLLYTFFYPAFLSYLSGNLQLLIYVIFTSLCSCAFFFKYLHKEMKWGFLKISLLCLLIQVLFSYSPQNLFLERKAFDFLAENNQIVLLVILTILSTLVANFIKIVFYYWVYVQWKYNIWVVILLRFVIGSSHGFSGEGINGEKMSDLLAFALQFYPFVITIIGTLLYKKKYST